MLYWHNCIPCRKPLTRIDTARLPISPRIHFINTGTKGGTRTPRIWFLRPARIPNSVTLALFFFWYKRRGSNPHAHYRRWILSPLCIPFHHSCTISLAEDPGIEPGGPFLNGSLANSCRTLQHIFPVSYLLLCLHSYDYCSTIFKLSQLLIAYFHDNLLASRHGRKVIRRLMHLLVSSSLSKCTR